MARVEGLDGRRQLAPLPQQELEALREITLARPHQRLPPHKAAELAARLQVVPASQRQAVLHRRRSCCASSIMLQLLPLPLHPLCLHGNRCIGCRCRSGLHLRLLLL